MGGKLHSDPGAAFDSPIMAAGADNNQLTLSFQGQVYVFDSVSPFFSSSLYALKGTKNALVFVFLRLFKSFRASGSK